MENIALKDIKTQMMADRDSLEVRILCCAALRPSLTRVQHFKKKMKSAVKVATVPPVVAHPDLQKLEGKEEKLKAKLAKGKDDKASQELREVEAKKNDLLLLFKAYESRQYTKWVQQYIQVRLASHAPRP